MDTVTDITLIYRLTTNPDEKVECPNTAEQKREIAKARSRLHRTAGSFSISESQVDDKIFVWRV